MTLRGTESGVEALSDSDIQLYESYTIRAWATPIPPTATLQLYSLYQSMAHLDERNPQMAWQLQLLFNSAALCRVVQE